MKMNVAIYGAGKYGQYIYNEIAKNDEAKVSVVNWIDNFVKEKQICGLPVYTEDDFFLSGEFEKIDGVVVAMISTEAEAVAASMLLRGYTKIYMAFPKEQVPVLAVGGGNFSSFIKPYMDTKPRLSYIEVPVTHQCNLKCKRCANFSNLVVNDDFLELSKMEGYLIQLKKKFHSILRFNLVGGEPLLNKSLHKYVALIRTYFPRTSIAITTNGILIPDITQELIDIMKQSQAFFYISQYPVTREKLVRIINFLENEQLFYEITPPRTQFKKILCFKEQNGETAFCNWANSMCMCHSIDNGRIYLCSNIARLYAMQDYFDLSIDEDELNASSINLMSDENDGWEIIKYFAKPVSLCRFCSPKDLWEKWETGYPRKEDWIAD